MQEKALVMVKLPSKMKMQFNGNELQNHSTINVCGEEIT